MKVINMTPHSVHIVGEGGQVQTTYPASGNLIRLKAETETIGNLPDGTPVSRTFFGDPQGLPSWDEDTVYIVSQLVKNALPERDDLLVPAEVVRDGKGNVMGCKSLGR